MGGGSSKAYAPYMLWSRVLVRGEKHPSSPGGDETVIITFIRSTTCPRVDPFLHSFSCLTQPLKPYLILQGFGSQIQRPPVWGQKGVDHFSRNQQMFAWTDFTVGKPCLFGFCQFRNESDSQDNICGSYGGGWSVFSSVKFRNLTNKGNL